MMKHAYYTFLLTAVSMVVVLGAVTLLGYEEDLNDYAIILVFIGLAIATREGSK